MLLTATLIPVIKLLATDQPRLFHKPVGKPAPRLVASLDCHCGDASCSGGTVAATINPEHMAESDHRITRPEFPDYRELFRESDIKSAVAFFNISYSISIRCSFFQLTYFDLFRCYRRGFWCFALTLFTQLLDPLRHREKTRVHSLRCLSDCVILVDNLLSEFSFKFRAEISSFHWSICVLF